MSDLDQRTRPEFDDSWDLTVLFDKLWTGRWIIVTAIVLSAVLSLVVALILPNVYRADATLAPNRDDSANSLSSLAAQYGNLAGLAGINLGGASNDETLLGLEILGSRRFITEFIRRRNLLVPLVAATGWDSETGELQIDSDIYDIERNEWVRSVSPPLKTKPSSLEAYEKFKDGFFVQQDKTSGFITIEIEHFSPFIAKQWVEWIIADLNQEIVTRDMLEAERAISYLDEQIESTPLADLRTVFYSLIEEQTKTIMLAKVSDEYFLKTLDPAVVPEFKHSPNRILIIFFGVMTGGLCGILVALLWGDSSSVRFKASQ